MALVKRGLNEDEQTTRPKRRHWARSHYGSSTGIIVSLLSPSPFIRHLEFFLNPQALVQKYSSKEPKLILAVPASLSHGPSRSLFVDFAAVPDNVILLTNRGEEGTLARVLFDRWNSSQRGDDTWDKGKIGSNVMMDGSLHLRVPSFFFSHTLSVQVLSDEFKSPSPRR